MWLRNVCCRYRAVTWRNIKNTRSLHLKSRRKSSHLIHMQQIIHPWFTRAPKTLRSGGLLPGRTWKFLNLQMMTLQFWFNLHLSMMIYKRLQNRWLQVCIDVLCCKKRPSGKVTAPTGVTKQSSLTRQLIWRLSIQWKRFTINRGHRYKNQDKSISCKDRQQIRNLQIPVSSTCRG